MLTKAPSFSLRAVVPTQTVDNCRRHITTHSKKGKIFEFRTYEVEPAKMTDFIALTNQKSMFYFHATLVEKAERVV
jgi:hypothetical protein